MKRFATSQHIYSCGETCLCVGFATPHTANRMRNGIKPSSRRRKSHDRKRLVSAGYARAACHHNTRDVEDYPPPEG